MYMMKTLYDPFFITFILEEWQYTSSVTLLSDGLLILNETETREIFTPEYITKFLKVTLDKKKV